MQLDSSACGDAICWEYFNENVSGQFSSLLSTMMKSSSIVKEITQLTLT